ncbi:MAG: amidohydrolase family protein [Acidobacteria bacterium]|nr:amidohydrolase family protein [Acidobacteriota bacterium]
MRRRWAWIAGVLLATVVAVSVMVVQAQRGRASRAGGAVLSVEDYTPRSTLVVDANPVPRARFPVIDVHSHHWPGFTAGRLGRVAAEMDALNLAVLVNLSGGTGTTLERCVDTVAQSGHRNRMVCFANLDFSGGVGPGFGERAASQLERDVAAGAVGLKFFKDFGISVRDRRGRRVPVDHPELDPVFETAGRLGIPVLMHVGEPQSFYEPVDRFNERWLELTLLPERRLPADRFPSFESMMVERDRRFLRHPGTTFIAAHMGWHANDLGRLGKLLDQAPNVYAETGAILYELGRQPRTARAFFTRYQDRILFGKDRYAPDEFPYYWRTFETADEYFDYYRRYHAFWKMYGLDLPDEVLRRVYYRNALDVIPGIDRSLFPVP